jgi:hypothetical protein
MANPFKNETRPHIETSTNTSWNKDPIQDNGNKEKKFTLSTLTIDEPTLLSKEQEIQNGRKDRSSGKGGGIKHSPKSPLLQFPNGRCTRDH